MRDLSGNATSPGRKVIGFDSWTGGAHHYQRLMESLRRKGLELTLVHLGSWGSDKGRLPIERIGDLLVKDISSYQKRDFTCILDSEQPSAVIFLSTDTFAHRAFNRYCRHRNLPTINLYHGLVRVQAVDDGSPYKINLLAHLRFVSSRLLKALILVWPTYAAALWRTGASPSAWVRFGRDILMGALGKFSLDSAEDARTDMCCVYVAADIDHAIKKYSFKRENVVAVGNPDLVRFGLSSSLIQSHLRPSTTTQSNVMYVDTGLIYTGFVFNSPEEFIRHMIETRNVLAKSGKHLVFKPHPDHSRTNILSELADAGVDVCSNADFVSRLQNCCACIVEPSTLSVLPALMGMPLFLAQYGKLAQQRFGEVLASYPRAVLLSRLEEFDALLASAENDCDAERTGRWIDENAGPLPAADMPDRVAEIVESVIVERARM